MQDFLSGLSNDSSQPDNANALSERSVHKIEDLADRPSIADNRVKGPRGHARQIADVENLAISRPDPVPWTVLDFHTGVTSWSGDLVRAEGLGSGVVSRGACAGSRCLRSNSVGDRYPSPEWRR